MKKFLSSLCITLGIIAAVAVSYYSFSYAVGFVSKGKLGDSGFPNQFISATNSSSSVSAATTTAVLAYNPVRQYASICNDSANTVYLSFGVPAVASKGYRLASAACYELPSYLGAVNAIASSSTSTLMTLEK